MHKVSFELLFSLVLSFVFLAIPPDVSPSTAALHHLGMYPAGPLLNFFAVINLNNWLLLTLKASAILPMFGALLHISQLHKVPNNASHVSCQCLVFVFLVPLSFTVLREITHLHEFFNRPSLRKFVLFCVYGHLSLFYECVYTRSVASYQGLCGSLCNFGEYFWFFD